jgi:hypothetical protein
MGGFGERQLAVLREFAAMSCIRARTSVAFSSACAWIVIAMCGPSAHAVDALEIPAFDADGGISEPSESEPACPVPQDCPPRWTFGADYLLIRPSFSNNTALYQATSTAQQSIALSPLNYDFGFASGVRGFLGYNFSRDTLARFSYLGIDAATSVFGVATGNYTGGDGTAVFGPMGTQAIPDGASIRSSSNVSLDLYDMELARRFELDPDVNNAPRWDTAGSAGIRFMDSAVTSTIDNFCPQCPNYIATTDRVFQGVGPRLALQGRRYLGPRRRWSAFATGGAALLVGNYQNVDTRERLPVNGFTRLVESQAVNGTLVVPNFDISLGTSWQWRERTSISAGWMLMYWGQLGYSETIDTSVAGDATTVPLTNSSLAYDGFFFRLTHTF